MRVLCLAAAAPSGGGASFTRVGKSFDSSLQHIYERCNAIQAMYAMPCTHHKLQTQNMLHDAYVPVDIPNCCTSLLIYYSAKTTVNRRQPKKLKSEH